MELRTLKYLLLISIFVLLLINRYIATECEYYTSPAGHFDYSHIVYYLFLIPTLISFYAQQIVCYNLIQSII